jgi:hypothetical protein
VREQQAFTTPDKSAPAGAINLYNTKQRHPTQADDEGGYDQWPTRLPSSSRRYYMPAAQRDVNAHPNQQINVPPRSSAAQRGNPNRALAPDVIEQPAARQRYTEESYAGQPKRRIHWLAIAGLSGIFMLVLVVAGLVVHNKWLSTMDDWTYTSSFRTFSIDQAVGHNGDSTTRPSHFIVQNDHTKIVIIEFPADDHSKVIVYYGPALLGDGQERTPATISFQTDPQTGRIDMVLHVEDQQYIFTNNGAKFVAPQGQ